MALGLARGFSVSLGLSRGFAKNCTASTVVQNASVNPSF
jgi:hypothetical protein